MRAMNSFIHASIVHSINFLIFLFDTVDIFDTIETRADEKNKAQGQEGQTYVVRYVRWNSSVTMAEGIVREISSECDLSLGER